MPRYYDPSNIEGHRTGTLTASVVAAYESFGASGLTPAADNVLAPLAGGAITAAACPGIVEVTVINYSTTDAVYITASDPAGLGSDAEVITLPAERSVEMKFAGHAGVDRVWVKGPAGAALVGVTVVYTEVPQ